MIIAMFNTKVIAMKIINVPKNSCSLFEYPVVIKAMNITINDKTGTK